MPRDREYFSEWEEWAEHWVEPNETYAADFNVTPQEGDQSIADWVISEVFELPIANPGKGSSLPGYDIKYREAYDMIQLSLAYHLKDNQLYECYANEIGEMEYYHIGGNAGGSSDIDEVYRIPSVAKMKPVENVMIIGYDPPPERTVGTEYDLFTFYSEHADPSDADYDTETYPKYHAWVDILGPEQCTYAKEGYIEYGDPHFDQQQFLARAGIDPVYDNVVTYIYKISVDWFELGATRVEFANKTPRYVTLDSMGKLMTRKWTVNNTYVSEFCRDDQKLSAGDISQHGVQLPDSDNKKFLGVREVYIYGYRVNRINLDYYSEGNERISGPATFLIDVDTRLHEPFRLSRGDDYIIVKDSDSGTGHYKIIFPCNIHPDYVESFGSLEGREDDARISPASIYTSGGAGEKLTRVNILDIFNPTVTVEGVLKDGSTEVSNTDTIEVDIFPMGEGQSGYAMDKDVGKVVVVYDWDNPCVALYDENNNVTSNNMNNVSVTFYPIIMHDARAPVAYNGGLLDYKEVVPDYDATTVEDLDASEYARAFSELSSGDIKMTLPFVGPDEAIAISNNLRDLTNTSEGRQATIVCNPGSEPRIGASVGDGMVINSIDYSYQDSSQYLISIQAGPMWLGMSGWDTSVYQNKTERLQLEGAVIFTYENNHRCQVDVQQIGVMDCINGTRDIIEQGDRVTVSIFNNPVSV